MSRPGDRHKGQRQYVSGAKKRKQSSAKLVQQQEEAKRSRAITDFLTSSSSVAAASKSPEVVDKPTSTLQQQVVTEPEGFVIHDISVTGTSDKVVMATGSSRYGDSDGVNRDCNSSAVDYGFNNDIGLWPGKCTSAMIDFWSSKDTNDLQSISGHDFSKSVRNVTNKNSGKVIKRSCTELLFQRIHPNGEIIKRTRLCYSPTTGRVYCFACRLKLSTVDGQLTGDGFDDWKHAGREIQRHEKSSNHSNSVCNLVQRAH